MTSKVTSFVNCVECGYNFCKREADDTIGGESFFCFRCGSYSKRSIVKYDIENGKKIYYDAINLKQAGRINEAIEALALARGMRGSEDFNPQGVPISKWSDKEKLQELEETLNWIKDVDFEYLFLVENRCLAFEDESNNECLGTFWAKDKSSGVIIISTKSADCPSDLKALFNNLTKTKEDIGFTQLKEGKWFAISLKFGKQAEFHDDDCLVGGERVLVPFSELVSESGNNKLRRSDLI